MGCNGSKSVAAVLATDTGDSATTAEEATADSTKNSTHEPGSVTDNSSTRPVTPQPIPPSMAFDIPFDKDPDSSIVKRHPPKRLQKLEEQQQQTTPLSLQELQDKQEEAEQRRQQFLQLRAQSAKRKYAMRNNNDLESKPAEADEGHNDLVDGEHHEEVAAH